MKKTIFILFLIILVSGCGQEISKERAEEIAKSYLIKDETVSDITLIETYDEGPKWLVAFFANVELNSEKVKNVMVFPVDKKSGELGNAIHFKYNESEPIKDIKNKIDRYKIAVL